MAQILDDIKCFDQISFSQMTDFCWRATVALISFTTSAIDTWRSIWPAAVQRGGGKAWTTAPACHYIYNTAYWDIYTVYTIGKKVFYFLWGISGYSMTMINTTKTLWDVNCVCLTQGVFIVKWVIYKHIKMWMCLPVKYCRYLFRLSA